MHTIRAVGALVVILIVAPTLEAFFAWQAICSITSAVILGSYFYFKVIGVHKWTYDFSLSLEKLFKGFRITLVGSFLVIMTQQIDKWYIISLVSSYEYGALALATTLGAALNLFVYALLNIMYPRIAKHYAQADYLSVKKYIYLSLNFIMIFNIIILFVIHIFGGTIINLWLQDLELAQAVFKMLKYVIFLNIFLFLLILLQPIYFLFNLGRVFLSVFALCILSGVCSFPWVFAQYGIAGPVLALALCTGLGLYC